MDKTATIAWTIGAIVIGLVGSAYGPQIRSLIEFGPRKFAQLAENADAAEWKLIERLYNSPYLLTLYLGRQVAEAGIWAMIAMLISFFARMVKMEISPIALAGGTVFGIITRNERVLRRLWNYHPPSLIT
jgi:hypothetical protein